MPIDTSSAACHPFSHRSIRPSRRSRPLTLGAGVDDERRWGPSSMRVCTTCFAPLRPREARDARPRFLRRSLPARAPNALVEPDDGLLRTRRGPRFASCFAPPSHLLGASGVRRCGGLDCAPWSLRPSSSRPRAKAAAATRAPRGLWASCLRARTAALSARRRLSSVSRAARVPPNPQVSERARKARRAR